MNLQDVQNQQTKPNFWQSSIKPYPIFFFAVFLIAPIIFFGPHGIKEVYDLNKGTGWPLVFSIILWGFVIFGLVWFWLNHRKIVKIWKREQQLRQVANKQTQ